MTSRELVRAARLRVANAGAIVRRIIGAPDYDRYVAHLRDHHPGRAADDVRRVRAAADGGALQPPGHPLLLSAVGPGLAPHA